jgi:hypothetical protein
VALVKPNLSALAEFVLADLRPRFAKPVPGVASAWVMVIAYRRRTTSWASDTVPGSFSPPVHQDRVGVFRRPGLQRP